MANVGVVLLAVIALLLLVGLFLPREYNVERSIDIQASPDAIFADLTALRRWPDWTVWNRDRDPGLEVTYGTTDTGVGAVYSWKGPKLGDGSLELVRADPATGVAYKLSFDKGTILSDGAIRLEKVAGVVRVTWNNHGNLGKNPVNRYFGLLMDRMVGPDFEQGLRNLKARAEKAGK